MAFGSMRNDRFIKQADTLHYFSEGGAAEEDTQLVQQNIIDDNIVPMLNVRHCHSDIPHVIDQLVKANIVLIDILMEHLEHLKLSTILVARTSASYRFFSVSLRSSYVRGLSGPRRTPPSGVVPSASLVVQLNVIAQSTEVLQSIFLSLQYNRIRCVHDS
ncbi:hypothetical protein Tco_0044952 [Tanacetum coccineum]